MKIRTFTRSLLAILTGCALSACSSLPGTSSSAAQQAAGDKLSVFSGYDAAGMPGGWAPILINRSKKPTRYQLVTEQGKTVLHAKADSAASALMHQVQIEPSKKPWLSWQWKVAHLIEGANNYERSAEDSPVRIVLAFDGDKDSLPFADQIMFETGKIVTGHEIPFATLMYIWENKAAVGTVIPNTRTDRVKMMVAASGEEGVGQWRQFSRNIIDDYERAFGEKPGQLIGVGVLTDTDNTGEVVEAWYGDIRLLQNRQIALN